MKHPISRRQRAYEAYGNFWFGEQSDGDAFFFVGVSLIASIIVGLCTIGTWPVWANLLATLAPITFVVLSIGAGFVCVKDKDLWEWHSSIDKAWKIAEGCSDTSRDTAYEAVNEIVRIARRNASNEIKSEHITKHLKTLEELQQVDINLQNELARESMNDLTIQTMRNTINAIESARQDLVARRA